MSPPEPDDDLWLPDVDQLTMAPERATLAALDVLLLLAIRVLHAEHPGLDEAASREPLLAIPGSMVLLADSLHQLIASYRLQTAHALGDDRRPDPHF